MFDDDGPNIFEERQKLVKEYRNRKKTSASNNAIKKLIATEDAHELFGAIVEFAGNHTAESLRKIPLEFWFSLSFQRLKGLCEQAELRELTALRDICLKVMSLFDLSDGFNLKILGFLTMIDETYRSWLSDDDVSVIKGCEMIIEGSSDWLDLYKVFNRTSRYKDYLHLRKKNLQKLLDCSAELSKIKTILDYLEKGSVALDKQEEEMIFGKILQLFQIKAERKKVLKELAGIFPKKSSLRKTFQEFFFQKLENL
ncbi:MAG: hypothetical protein NT116_03995 [Candidatus Parcubacteria bacterium]|nr:hypothetical protein [Candidatus Parcubacteria bacterium]